jgi:SulP family sulfate permease
MAKRLAWLLKRVPALEALRDYSWQALGGDLTAGITVATVAAPQAMAYATLAGVPPEYGLYTAIVVTGVGALFDSSRQLINGPTNAISIALLSALAVVPLSERVPAAVLLALLVGLVQLGIALLRLGDLSRYVSRSVLVGFTLGAGTLLVLDQMKNLLGLPSGGGPEDHFLKRLWLSLTSGAGIHGPTVLIGAGTIAVVVAVRGLNGVLRRRGARFPIPQHLVAVGLMAALVWGLELDDRSGVKIVGPIHASLPHFRVPMVTWEQTRLLAGNAFAIALLGLLEAIAMAKAIAARTGQRLDINQQCFSEGAANLVGSFFQCFPGSGSLTRSAVNQQAGAVSQWSGVFAAIAVAGTVLLFAPMAQYIPRASLAGLLMLAAFRMVDREQLVFHLRATRFDAGVVIATAVAAVAISVEFCILVGVFLSFVLYVPRAAQVRMIQLVRTTDQRVRPRQGGERIDDELLIYHLQGELFFGTEPDLEAHCAAIADAAHGKVRAVILVLDRARNPDAGFLMLLRTLNRHLARRGVALILCGVAADLGPTFTCTDIGRQTAVERVFCDPEAGAGADLEGVPSACYLLDNAACPTCPRRQVPKAKPPLDYTI